MLSLSDDILASIKSYKQHLDNVSSLSKQLQLYNKQIDIVKEKAASSNLITLNADMANLKLIKTRFAENTVHLSTWPLMLLLQAQLKKNSSSKILFFTFKYSLLLHKIEPSSVS